MKKIQIISLLVAVMMLILSACSKPDNPMGNSSHAKESVVTSGSSENSGTADDDRNQGSAQVEYDTVTEIPPSNVTSKIPTKDDKVNVILVPPKNLTTSSQGQGTSSAANTSSSAGTSSENSNNSSNPGSSSSSSPEYRPPLQDIIIEDNGKYIKLKESGTDVKIFKDLNFDGDPTTDDFIITFLTGPDCTVRRIYGYVHSEKILVVYSAFYECDFRFELASEKTLNVFLTPLDLSDISNPVKTGDETLIGTISYIYELGQYEFFYNKKTGLSSEISKRID